VYHQFPDKETIFNTLLEQYWEALDQPDLPFNKALAEGAFPDNLEALARERDKASTRTAGAWPSSTWTWSSSRAPTSDASTPIWPAGFRPASKPIAISSGWTGCARESRR
jgi:AcrR family transcriptional regulator